MVLYFFASFDGDWENLCGVQEDHKSIKMDFLCPFLISWLPGLCQKVIKSFEPPSYRSKPFKHLFAKFDDDPAQLTPCKIWIFKKIQEINSFRDVIKYFFQVLKVFPNEHAVWKSKLT